MNRKITLIMLLGLFSVLGSEMVFDVERSKKQGNRQWTRVKLGVKSNEKALEYIYTQIPKGWRQIKNMVYIPKKQLSKNRKFPCKVIVKNQKGGQIRGTVLFIAKNKKLTIDNQIFDYEYEFSDDFFVEGGFAGKPEFIKQSIIQSQTRRTTFFRNRRRRRREQNFSKSQTRNKVEPSQNTINTIESVQIIKGQQIIQYNQNIQTINNSDLEIVQPRTIEQSKKLINTSGSGLQKIVSQIVVKEELALTTNKQVQKVQQLARSQSQRTSQIRSIQSIFSRLPTAEELDEIILTADIYVITKTIQQVVSDQNLLCEQKISYLLDFAGRIRSAVKIKTFTLSQLKVIVEVAKTEIQRLEKQIGFTEGEIERLRIWDLREKLALEVDKLQDAYNRFNEVDSSIQPKQLVVEGLNSEVKQLRGKANRNRESIVNKRLELTQAEADIYKLEQQLADAKGRKVHIIEEIDRLVAQISDIEAKINNLLNQKTKIEQEISRLNQKADDLKTIYTLLEITVERIRSDLMRASEKEEQFQKRIEELEDRLIMEQEKIVDQEIKLLQHMIKQLSDSFPSINQKVNHLYYECYQAGNVTEETSTENVIYVMNPNSFSSYILKAYGLVPNFTPSSVSFQTVDIFSSSWTKSFGYAFEESQLAQTKQFSFASDFNCLNPSTVVSSRGKIIKIQNNTIYVTLENETQAKLILGACSRLESISYIPQIGQKIYWKGNYKNQIYEVYSASCF